MAESANAEGSAYDATAVAIENDDPRRESPLAVAQRGLAEAEQALRAAQVKTERQRQHLAAAEAGETEAQSKLDEATAAVDALQGSC